MHSICTHPHRPNERVTALLELSCAAVLAALLCAVSSVFEQHLSPRRALLLQQLQVAKPTCSRLQ